LVIDLDYYPVVETGVVGRILGSPEAGRIEAVIVLPTRGKIDVLNEVGARIWSLVDGRRSLRQIALMISTEYEVDATQAEADTLNFLEDLQRRGAIAFNPEPQS
jgi:hypothetical protein